MLLICKSISNETGWGAHGRETDSFEGSVKYAGGTGTCACGQPVNERPSATLCCRPIGIVVHQTEKQKIVFTTFRCSLYTAEVKTCTDEANNT